MITQSRSQSFVPLDQRSENESSGSIHFEITIGNNRILVIRLTGQSQSQSMYAIAHAWNGCSQSSRFPTAGQGKRSSWNEIDDYLENKAFVRDQFCFPWFSRTRKGYNLFCVSVTFHPTCFTTKSTIARYTCALHPFSFDVTSLAACSPIETRLRVAAAVVTCR